MSIDNANDPCSPLSSVMAEERPITIDEACALRLLLFGNTMDSFNDAWTEQSFHFRSVPSYGFIQKKAGPCGLLAAVQAYVIHELLFGNCRINSNAEIQKLKIGEKRNALARALTTILWQAGDKQKAIVAVKRDIIVLNDSVTSDILQVDGLLEYVQLKYFDCQGCLLEYFINFISEMMSDDYASCVLFLYSLILSHGIQRIREEMDYPDSYLIGNDGYCSQEVINLILVGKAVANLFDGDMELNSGGSETSIHRGIPKQSPIGLLSLYEYHETCTVGNNYKNPSNPIWLLLGECHFTVLFARSKDIFNETSLEDSFMLYHYDGLAKRHAETVYIIKPFFKTTSPEKDKSIAVAVRCIYTRWPLASVESKDDPLDS